VAVELSAYRCECVRSEGGKDWPFACYQFQIRAKGGYPFAWSCWVPDCPSPHAFEVLTAPSGQSYACYIDNGLDLFHITQPRDSESVRKDFWNGISHPDRLPSLNNLLFETVDRNNLIGLGPTTWNITVDSVAESGGDLVLILHGRKPQLKYTFALKNGKWVFVSKQDNP
jgi:hypothetical protein